MSAAREATPSEGGLRARREAQARRGRPSALSEARGVTCRIDLLAQGGRPKSPPTRDYRQADASPNACRYRSNEADA